MPIFKNNRRRFLSSLGKLVYKYANACFVTLNMMMPFLPDFSYYKHTTLILKLFKMIEIELIKSDNVNKQV